jgi:hypothetical protein
MPLLRVLAFLLLAAAATQVPDQQHDKSTTDEPKLPVIDFKACGSGDFSRRVPFNVTKPERIYSSWRSKRTSAGILTRGEEVTIVGGVNVIREPARAVIKSAVLGAPTFTPGDSVLGYGYDADGTMAFWGKGVWFTEDAEHVSVKGNCGFTDKSECKIDIVQDGLWEWWVQARTASGSIAWILGATGNGDKYWRSDNFGRMCRD